MQELDSMVPRSLVTGYTCDVEVNMLTSPLILIPRGATWQKPWNTLLPTKAPPTATPPTPTPIATH